MQDKATQDGIATLGPQSRLPPQARPVGRTLLTSGTIERAVGIEPQILPQPICDEAGCHFGRVIKLP